MSRKREYQQLADDMFRRAAYEESAQLEAQWKILGARYLEIAKQSPQADEKNTVLKIVQRD